MLWGYSKLRVQSRWDRCTLRSIFVAGVISRLAGVPAVLPLAHVIYKQENGQQVEVWEMEDC
jgi:hypothetical protein